MPYQYRELTTADEPVVWQMLVHAAHEPNVDAVRSDLSLSRYAIGWGRAGDAGVMALADGRPVGAAWLRLWPSPDKGFGWVADTVPELAMAVVPECRGRGIGTELLTRVLKLAQATYGAVSLNVRKDNAAVRLYERSGFVRVEGSSIVNRTGGISHTMLKRFEASTSAGQ